ncbi:MAG: LysM peptidoglycan-binding domain-containing protein [Alphaproteobacteria bacterium]|nr:MAG: LysM peptidoglycan-binding domain-containing protein [Alphaproteobacteria bacterium]
MSPRLIAIFAGLVLVTLALGGYFYLKSDGDVSKIPANISSLISGEDERPAKVTPQKGPVLPTFDVVRVDAKGTAVIAGRGEKGATVKVFANGKEVATVEVDNNGEWAIYIDTPLNEGAQELTLEMTTASGELRKSEQVVVIAVPERAGEKPLVVLGEPGSPSRILQDPRDSEGIILALDVIDYDEEGAVHLSGRSTPGASLRVYADNVPIGETSADDQGYWSLTPGGTMTPGVYSLRIDQLGEDGRVLARVEVPFERAEVSDILAAVAKGGGRLVVQPGNSLWRIARRVYGSGFEYTIIYDANQDQIRDPNLIYPGQIFDLPKKYEVDDEIHLLN